MRILLTGATGFVGSHVARTLVKAGHEVHALIRKDSNTRRIKDILPSLKVVDGGLENLDCINGFLKQKAPEVCIHLAWYAEPGKYLDSTQNISLLNSSLLLITKLAESGCGRIIATGSCFEYDTDIGYLSEMSRTMPKTLYAASKLSLQMTMDTLCGLLGMKYSWVRLFYLYGPYEDERRLVPYVIKGLLNKTPVKLTKGDQIRDFMYIEDIAKGIVAIMNNNVEGVVNLGSGKPISVRDICMTIGQEIGRADLLKFGAQPDRSGDPPFICANSSLLLKSTSWTPAYELRDGLNQTIEWWKSTMNSKSEA